MDGQEQDLETEGKIDEQKIRKKTFYQCLSPEQKQSLKNLMVGDPPYPKKYLKLFEDHIKSLGREIDENGSKLADKP